MSRALARRARDPGLQAERTALAWNRTGLALLVNAMLALREGWSGGRAPITALALALLVAAAAAVAYGAWRRHHLAFERGMIAVPAAAVAATAAITLLACATGIASILVR